MSGNSLTGGIIGPCKCENAVTHWDRWQGMVKDLQTLLHEKVSDREFRNLVKEIVSKNSA